MHIAICDDNVADRKHLERLLSRESDKRAGTPNILYVDSYGEKTHFLANPLKYNLIFMDMTSEEGIVEYILERLDAMGYNAPLILYSSKIDYTAIPSLPDYVVHAKKPYLPDALPEFLALGDANMTGHVISIKVHRQSIDRNVPKNDIMYILDEDSRCQIYTTDGQSFDVDEDIGELRILLEPYEEFERVNKKGIVNFKYVSAVMPLEIVMQNYVQIKIPVLQYRAYKQLKERIDALE